MIQPTPPAPRPPAEKWGERAAVVWFLGGFAALLACTLAGTGPFAWAASWQMRHWGYDNVMLAFLPGFAGLLAPFVVAALLPRRPGWPFVNGVKAAMLPPDRAAASRLPQARIVHRLQVGSRIGAGIAIVGLVAGGLGTLWVLQPGPLPPGTPLPAIPLAAAESAALPGPVRITGAVAQAGAAWVHDEVVRSGSIHDTYLPLTPPGWRPGDPVAMLELVRGSGRTAPTPVDPAGPHEGTLRRGGIPSWMLDAMRDSGLPVGPAPMVLTRQDWGGVVPGPDWVDASLPLAGGVVAALFGSLLAFSFRRARMKEATARPSGR